MFKFQKIPKTHAAIQVNFLQILGYFLVAPHTAHRLDLADSLGTAIDGKSTDHATLHSGGAAMQAVGVSRGLGV